MDNPCNIFTTFAAQSLFLKTWAAKVCSRGLCAAHDSIFSVSQPVLRSRGKLRLSASQSGRYLVWDIQILLLCTFPPLHLPHVHLLSGSLCTHKNVPSRSPSTYTRPCCSSPVNRRATIRTTGQRQCERQRCGRHGGSWQQGVRRL